jgi:hypothetical protein
VSLKTVNIRPGVSILSILPHLNYKPWFALAEFVDNSIQSAIKNGEALRKVGREDYQLRVDISMESDAGGRIIIRDNAAGIHIADFPRAFRPAELPADRTMLSEFGMGMKSASCWFSKRWMVRTSALGEPTERVVRFDIDQIVRDDIEELQIEERQAHLEAHFTEVVLEDVQRLPQGRTLGKIKEHLRDIYREFLRDGSLSLRFNEEALVYEEPDILEAPYWHNRGGPSRVWRKELAFDFGDGLSVSGFAAIRKVGSNSRAGFALFRRRRLIQGSGDEGYKPASIFGLGNSYASQRLFGELHLEGFDVSHTKDGFKWDENEQPFLELLKEELSRDDFPILQQVRDFRARAPSVDPHESTKDLDEQASDMLLEEFAPAHESLGPLVQAENVDEQNLPATTGVLLVEGRRTAIVRTKESQWSVQVEVIDDPAVGDWMSVTMNSQAPVTSRAQRGERNARVVLNVAHPLVTSMADVSRESLDPLIRMSIAFAISELDARDAGVSLAALVRRRANELLREASWTWES